MHAWTTFSCKFLRRKRRGVSDLNESSNDREAGRSPRCSSTFVHGAPHLLVSSWQADDPQRNYVFKRRLLSPVSLPVAQRLLLCIFARRFFPMVGSKESERNAHVLAFVIVVFCCDMRPFPLSRTKREGVLRPAYIHAACLHTCEGRKRRHSFQVVKDLLFVFCRGRHTHT